MSKGASSLSPFRHRIFAVIWTATVVSNIGGWMYGAASSWLMTTLNSDPLMVALVQGASSLPLFLFALPAGALADIADARRLILWLEIGTTMMAAIFAALVYWGLVSPISLLLLVFLLGTFSALEVPAWQSIVPRLVPRDQLSAAIAVNSVGVNISRAIGPALAGLLISGWGMSAPFWIDAFSNIGVIFAFAWWRQSSSVPRTLPAEHLMGAIRAGVRYGLNNSYLQATLLRAIGFYLFASAYWALLPLVARNQIAGGPELYGIMLGVIGVSAVTGGFALPYIKARCGAEGSFVIGQIGTAVSLILLGLAHGPLLALAGSCIAGFSWITVLATLNLSAQVALPDWVRGRGLAMYATVFFGTMTIGSALWGEVASLGSLSTAHFIAAGGALLAIPITRRWKLQAGAGIDFSPSAYWPAPAVSGAIAKERGPVLITVSYRISPENTQQFLGAVARLSHLRKRDGAYAWSVFEDAAEASRYLETFLVESWLEHLRQHERATKADWDVEDRVVRFTVEPPIVTHYIAATRNAPRKR